MRYVDDTLVLIKPTDIPTVAEKLNNYHENLNFTYDTFQNDIVHFLDIKIVNNQTDVYYKPTHTGQYTHFSSYTPWRLKTSWINALYHRSKKICSSTELFSKQLSLIKSFSSWNGYPKNARNALLHRLSRNNRRVNNDEDDQFIKLYFRLPYAGLKGEQLVKSCIRKMRRFLKTNVKFIVLYDTKKISYFCTNKDKVPELQRHNVVLNHVSRL